MELTFFIVFHVLGAGFALWTLWEFLQAFTKIVGYRRNIPRNRQRSLPVVVFDKAEKRRCRKLARRGPPRRANGREAHFIGTWPQRSFQDPGFLHLCRLRQLLEAQHPGACMRRDDNVDDPIVVYWVPQISPAFAVEYEKPTAAADPDATARNCERSYLRFPGKTHLAPSMTGFYHAVSRYRDYLCIP